MVEAFPSNGGQTGASQGGFEEKNVRNGLKIQGLPYSATNEEIVAFFNGFGLVTETVKIGTYPDGKATGQAAALFEDADKARQAQTDLNKKYIGSRWVELILISTQDYNSFNTQGGGKFGGSSRSGGDYAQKQGGGDRGSGGGNFQQERNVHLSDYVTHENCQRSLKLRGLPYSATAGDIAKFFGAYSVQESDVIIDMSRGRPTGYALVFLPSEDDAARAMKELNHQHIGSRYVDVFYPTVRQ